MKLLLICLCMVAYLGCEKESGPLDVGEIDYGQIGEIKYSEHVQALLDARCVSCHGGTVAESGLKLDNWNNVIFGATSGEALIAYNSAESRLVKMLTQLDTGIHPKEHGGTAPQQDEIDFLARWIDEGARDDHGHSPYEHSHHSIYVCNQKDASVSVIDGHALVVTRYVDLAEMGYPDSQPHMIAIAPENDFWYVSLIAANKVLKFETETNELVGEIDIESPALLMQHPEDHILYVSRFIDASQSIKSIFAVDVETMEPASGTEGGEILLQGAVPHALTLDHDYIYTASLSEDLVMRISHESMEMSDLVHLGDGKGPLHCTLNGDGTKLFVSCITSDEMLVIDVSDPDQMTVVGAIPTGDDPWHPHFAHDEDADRELLYVGNNRSHNFCIIDPETMTAELVGAGDGSDGFAWPHGVAIDEQFIYFSNQNQTGAYTPRHDFGDNEYDGTVVILSREDLSVVKVMEVGEFATGIHLPHLGHGH